MQRRIHRLFLARSSRRELLVTRYPRGSPVRTSAQAVPTPELTHPRPNWVTEVALAHRRPTGNARSGLGHHER
jgi:hypothetical protein